MSMKSLYHLAYVTGLYRLLWHSDEPVAQVIRWHRGGLLRGARALDVGCGTGTHALWLAEQGFSVVAADFSEAALRRVERARCDAAIAPDAQV
jgi:2-polyprenyl-3-methyl-5-hydroxy-6-metoxy-1,4-benzoquinol methylase